MKEWIPLIQAVITFLFGGGCVGLVTLVWKIRPEAGKIVVDAAKGVVLMQSRVLEDVRLELKECREQLQKLVEENELLKAKIAVMELAQIKHEKQIIDMQTHANP